MAVCNKGYAAIIPADLAGEKWAVSILQTDENHFVIGGKGRGPFEVTVRELSEVDYLVRIANFGMGIVPKAVIPYDLIKECNIADLYSAFTLAAALRHLFSNDLVGD